MLPAGRITEETIQTLAGLLGEGDIIIDGGNTYYKDDIRRAEELAARASAMWIAAPPAGYGASSVATA